MLLTSLLHKASRIAGCPGIDRSNLWTFRPLTVGIRTSRTTQILKLAQAAARERRVNIGKSAALALSYLLNKVTFPTRSFVDCRLRTALEHLESDCLATHPGKPGLVIDTTEYPKRSRARGKAGRQMEDIGRVRTTEGRSKPPPTPFGSIDICAGLALKGKYFLPLVRLRSSSRPPAQLSQNRVAEAVLARARELAADWCAFLEQHARKIYQQEVARELVCAHELARRIEQGVVLDATPIRAIYRQGWADLSTADEVLAAAQVLEQYGWVRVEVSIPNARGGRPATVLRVNPAVASAKGKRR